MSPFGNYVQARGSRGPSAGLGHHPVPIRRTCGSTSKFQPLPSTSVLLPRLSRADSIFCCQHCLWPVSQRSSSDAWSHGNCGLSASNTRCVVCQNDIGCGTQCAPAEQLLRHITLTQEAVDLVVQFTHPLADCCSAVYSVTPCYFFIFLGSAQ